MDINKYLNINIGTAMKVNRNVKICSDHLKTKKICRHAVNKIDLDR